MKTILEIVGCVAGLIVVYAGVLMIAIPGFNEWSKNKH
jgi:hypothetical protein